MSEQTGRFEYDCQTPDCEGTMRGDFGDDVTCPVCGAQYATEWDYTDAAEGSMTAWLAQRIPLAIDAPRVKP